MIKTLLLRRRSLPVPVADLIFVRW